LSQPSPYICRRLRVITTSDMWWQKITWHFITDGFHDFIYYTYKKYIKNVHFIIVLLKRISISPSYETILSQSYIYNFSFGTKLSERLLYSERHLCNIYTTVFRVKWLNNQTWCMRLFNRLTRKTIVSMICNMEPCNTTSRSLVITRLSESNKTILTAQI
jgi:hypothetical protein